MYLDIIKSLRIDRDVKQSTISNYLHITQGAYARYESGSRSIPVDVIIKLCKFYNVSADYILGLKP